MANSLGGSYSTGRATVAAGGKEVEGIGTAWSLIVEQGDWFYANGFIAIIDAVIDNTHLALADPWPGEDLGGSHLLLRDAVSFFLLHDGVSKLLLHGHGENYRIIKMSWLRYDPALTQAKLRELIAALDVPTVIYNVTGDAPDPGIGHEGQYALKTNSGVWKLWLKVLGAWVSQGTPVGSNWQGVWSAGTTYAINDTVSRFGSAYISQTVNINKAPESNPNDWDLLTAKGTDGNHGGVSLRYIFSSLTADADPGNGALRLNSSTQNLSSIIRADLLDATGVLVTSVLDQLDASSSTIKAQLRLMKEFDPSRYIDFNLTARAAPSGYRNFVVAVIAASSANPFLEGDLVVLTATRTGDVGTQGPQGASITGPRGFPGGAEALQYNVDALSTQDLNPGGGALRFGAVPQVTSTTLHVSSSSALGNSVGLLLGSLATASTSAIKASARLYKTSDPSKTVTFDISGVTDMSGYFNLAIMVRGGSSPDPFVNGDVVTFDWAAKGDKGDAGTVAVGTTNTSAAGTTALVSNSGTLQSAVLNFTIPRGDKGDNFSPHHVVPDLTSRGTYDSGPVFDGNDIRLSVLVEVDASNGGQPTLYFLQSIGPAVWSHGFTFQSGESAELVSFDNSTAGLAATNVQDALDEEAKSIADIPDPVAMAMIFG